MKLTQEDDGLDHHLCRIVDRYLNISIVTVLSLRHAKMIITKRIRLLLELMISKTAVM